MTINGIPKDSEFSLIAVVALKPSWEESPNGIIRKFVTHQIWLPRSNVAEIYSWRRMKLESKLAWTNTIAKKTGLISGAGNCLWKMS
jgi:hypothetical protein